MSLRSCMEYRTLYIDLLKSRQIAEIASAFDEFQWKLSVAFFLRRSVLARIFAQSFIHCEKRRVALA